jgi:hypothetical protein
VRPSSKATSAGEVQKNPMLHGLGCEIALILLAGK